MLIQFITRSSIRLVIRNSWRLLEWFFNYRRRREKSTFRAPRQARPVVPLHQRGYRSCGIWASAQVLSLPYPHASKIFFGKALKWTKCSLNFWQTALPAVKTLLAFLRSDHLMRLLMIRHSFQKLLLLNFRISYWDSIFYSIYQEYGLRKPLPASELKANFSLRPSPDFISLQLWHGYSN